MRIISGKYRGKSLLYPKDPALRPTQDRVKEAMFGIVQFQVPDAVVLDLFCGTGSLGIEALSRGASHAVFVDKETKILSENLKKIDGSFKVFRSESYRFLKKNDRVFDLIFIDPPYERHDLYEETLNHIFEFGMLKATGIALCEHHRAYKIASLFPHITSSEHSYGDTKLTLFKV